MFENTFSFNGRIRRSEYCIIFIVSAIYLIWGQLSIAHNEGVPGKSLDFVIWAILYIPMLWLSLAEGAKRCHDIGNNGFYQFIPFFFLWMLFGPGNKGENEYGENPRVN